MLLYYNGELLVFIQVGKGLPPRSSLFVAAEIITMN
jgi:hypothetical protein